VPDDISAEPAVVVPPGAGLLVVATWVGHACWVELRWHEVLTGWLSAEEDHVGALAFWSLRADAGERGAAWHRRLPELREHPRHGFVRSSSGDVGAAFDRMVDLAEPAEAHHRLGCAVAVLGRLDAGYRRHVDVAVGPADSPVAATLTTALASVRRGLDLMVGRGLPLGPLAQNLPELP